MIFFLPSSLIVAFKIVPCNISIVRLVKENNRLAQEQDCIGKEDISVGSVNLFLPVTAHHEAVLPRVGQNKDEGDLEHGVEKLSYH